MTVQQLIDALEKYPDKRHEVMSVDGFVFEEVGTCTIDALPPAEQGGRMPEYKQCVLIEDYRPHPFWRIPALAQEWIIQDSWHHLSLWQKFRVIVLNHNMPIVKEEIRMRGVKNIYKQQYRNTHPKGVLPTKDNNND